MNYHSNILLILFILFNYHNIKKLIFYTNGSYSNNNNENKYKIKIDIR
jgi:hypothetical protein